MDLSEIKLVVTDMDGTLLNSKHEVSNLFFEQFKKLKENNVSFVAASGRQYHSILDKLSIIEKDITIVAENGAYIVRSGEPLFINDIPRKSIEQIIPICNAVKGVQMVICGMDKAYILKNNTIFEKTVSEFYTRYEALDSFDNLPKDRFFKIALCHYSGSESHVFPHIKNLEQDWQLKISGKEWIDISLKSTHKGNAIAKLQEQLKISQAQTMAFGDYNNDTEMLKLAKYSFAMGNAHPNIKKIANFETLTNDENGVETILSKLIDTF